jgi:hypothetical protein
VSLLTADILLWLTTLPPLRSHQDGVVVVAAAAAEGLPRPARQMAHVTQGVPLAEVPSLAVEEARALEVVIHRRR